jgi:3-oxoacyl-[acyl-carrier protein] reductase
MDIQLAGKTALVTGGNLGIGGAIARQLAECGAKVALTYYSHETEAAETVEQIEAEGGEAHAFQLDATDSAAVNTVTGLASDALGGRIDILVNNAGHLIGRVLISEMDDAHWHRVIDVNLSSTFYCTRAVLEHMPDGGRIVNMASLAARNGGSYGTAAYAASKAGVIGFTRGMAKELAPRGITVNVLAPGFIVDTPFHETFTGVEKYEGIVNSIPLQRAGVPDDVAHAVLFFVSDLGSWITGQAAEINGGAWFV